MSDRRKVLPQYMLPKRGLTAFAGRVAAARLDAALGAEIDVARVRLDTGADAASGHVRWLTAAVLVAIALAAVLVVAGLRARMREYR